MNSAAFQRRNEVVLGRVNVYTMHGSRRERLYLNKKPQTGMKWLFTRPENPKFNTSASTEREVQWAMVAISTQCSCSSQSIFYAIKNWEFGGRTPTHISILPLFVFPVFLFQLLKSTFIWFFRQRDWDYPDLTNNEVVGGFKLFHHPHLVFIMIVEPNCRWVAHSPKRYQRLQLRNSWTIRPWFQIVSR